MTSNDKVIPCIDCICLPVCRHKDYRGVVLDCEMLFSILYDCKSISMEDRDRHFNESILAVEPVLNPARWTTVVVENGMVHIQTVDEKKGVVYYD